MKAVILAGGLGTRLRPLTQAIPKPLLPIGEQTVLEIQISKLAEHGFKEVFVATNYKSKYIENFLGDGSQFGVKLKISNEETPLGTCGPLSLLKHELTEPFVMMNGDILTAIDFTKFYQQALSSKANLLVATKQVRTPFNFGSVEVKDDMIMKIEEKPDLVTEILAGIYCMKPEIFNLIPENEYFGMDHLILKMLKESIPVARYLMNEFWLDIGRLDDFNAAQEAYEKHMKEPTPSSS